MTVLPVCSPAFSPSSSFFAARVVISAVTPPVMSPPRAPSNVTAALLEAPVVLLPVWSVPTTVPPFVPASAIPSAVFAVSTAARAPARRSCRTLVSPAAPSRPRGRAIASIGVAGATAASVSPPVASLAVMLSAAVVGVLAAVFAGAVSAVRVVVVVLLLMLFLLLLLVSLLLLKDETACQDMIARMEASLVAPTVHRPRAEKCAKRGRGGGSSAMPIPTRKTVAFLDIARLSALKVKRFFQQRRETWVPRIDSFNKHQQKLHCMYSKKTKERPSAVPSWLPF